MIQGTNKDFIFEIEFPEQKEEVNDENRNITIVHVELECFDQNKNLIKLNGKLDL